MTKTRNLCPIQNVDGGVSTWSAFNGEAIFEIIGLGDSDDKI
jgi:hypothetical protein